MHGEHLDFMKSCHLARPAGLFRSVGGIAAISEEGKAREGVRAFGGGLRGVDWRFNSRRGDVETYFFWHEHNSCAAATLRAFLWVNQETMAVIIFSPPYFFSALHSSRLDSRLFYSRALPSASRFPAANGLNSDGQRGFTF
jgi:hypothetical protein